MRRPLHQASIERLLHGSYSFNISYFINEGYKLFKKSISLYAVFTLVFFLIQSFGEVNPIANVLVAICVTPMLNVGYALFANYTQYQEPAEFELFFKGYDRFKPLVSFALIEFGCMFAIFAAIGVNMFLGENYLDAFANELPLLSFLLLIPLLYLIVAWSWAPMFIVFNGLSTWEAMELSRKIITRRWFVFFGFMLMQGLIIFAGLLAFIIGILFTYPIAVLANYVAFSELTGLNEGEENEDDILSHLIMDN